VTPSDEISWIQKFVVAQKDVTSGSSIGARCARHVRWSVRDSGQYIKEKRSHEQLILTLMA